MLLNSDSEFGSIIFVLKSRFIDDLCFKFVITFIGKVSFAYARHELNLRFFKMAWI